MLTPVDASSLPLALVVATAGIHSSLLPVENCWLIDLGATDQMTMHTKIFTCYTTFWFPLMVTLADGSQALAICKGTIRINPYVLLDDVLLVTSFRMSFLSVQKLCSKSLY